jgi:hypothetical protein
MRKSLLMILALCLLVTYSRGNIAMGSMTTPASQSAPQMAPKGKPKPPVDVPVTSTIKDYIDWTDPEGTTRIQMQFQSDGAGPYANSQTVTSLIHSIGEWELDTGLNITNPTRSVYLDFSKGIPGSGPGGGNPTPPFTAGLVQPRFYAESSQSPYFVNILSIAGGQTVGSPLRIGFFYPVGGETQYRIHMTPESPIYPYPETDYVDITCTGVNANSQCNSWQIEPNGFKGGCVTADCSVKQNVVKLVKLVTVKGKLTEVNQGDFLMSFSVGVTNP